MKIPENGRDGGACMKDRLAKRTDYRAMVGIRARWLDRFWRGHPADQRWCPAMCKVPDIEDEQTLLWHLAGKDGRWAAVAESEGGISGYILCRTDMANEQTVIEGQTPRLDPEARPEEAGAQLVEMSVQQAVERGSRKLTWAFHGFADEVTPIERLYQQQDFAGEFLFEKLTHDLRIEPGPRRLEFRCPREIGLEAFHQAEVTCGYISSIERSKQDCEFSLKMWGDVRPDTDWLAAYEGPDLVATVRVAVSREGIGVLDAIAVLPERRRRGIGRAVLAQGLAALAGRTEVVRLDVHHDNPAAIRLYERAGFRTHHVRGEKSKDLAEELKTC